MIDIPPELQIKSTIKPGSVYYFEEETLTSNELHYFIVINNKPIVDKIILLVCASSRIKKVKQTRRHLPKTLVEIKERDYPDFTKDSIVDCNFVLSKTIDEVVEKLSAGNLKLKSEMDISIVENLREAVINSPVVDMEIIEMIV